MTPGGAAVAPVIAISLEDGVNFSLGIATEPDRSYRVQTSPDLRSWANVTNFVSTSASVNITNLGPSFPHQFFRAISP
jgi:hypothetical protein